MTEIKWPKVPDLWGRVFRGGFQMTVIKRGHADWADLKGEPISFQFTDGYSEPYNCNLVFSHTEPYHEDPRYPRYYVMDENGGGYSFREDEEVEVEILD